MSKSSNQKLKILYLAEIFRELTDESHGLTLAEIIKELERRGVSTERKSLYNDIEALRNFGMEIESRKDKTVRYYLVEREFELPELKLLVDAVQSSKFITRKKSSVLIKKIEGLASCHEAKQLQRQVFVANRIKTMNESIYYAVDEIHRAISENRQIVFQYFEWNFKKEKQLRRDGKLYSASPWALTWDDENYYMIAFDEENGIIKHYRVDKMQNIKVSSEKRLGEKLFENFDPAFYSRKTFGMYGGRDEQVTLRCRHSTAGIIVDRFGQDVIMYDVGNGYFELSVKVSVSPLFLSWVMNFGGDIVIISPERVIEEYMDLARSAVNVYERLKEQTGNE